MINVNQGHRPLLPVADLKRDGAGDGPGAGRLGRHGHSKIYPLAVSDTGARLAVMEAFADPFWTKIVPDVPAAT